MTGARLAPAFLLASLLSSPCPVPAQTPPQKIVIGGAQSLAPLAEKFSARFRKDHPGIEIEIRRANSNYGVAATESGELQIGLVTRNLTGAEKAPLHVESMGRDAIILLSYSWNTVAGLTLEQLRGIYSGKIVNWREVGGEDRGIVPLTREASSAVHAMFIDNLFGKESGGREKAFVLRASKDKILRTVKRVRGSLGYGIVPVEEAQAEGVKILAVDGKAPTEANIQQGNYRFTRPLLLVLKDRRDPLVQEWTRGFARLVAQGEASR